MALREDALPLKGGRHGPFQRLGQRDESVGACGGRSHAEIEQRSIRRHQDAGHFLDGVQIHGGGRDRCPLPGVRLDRRMGDQIQVGRHLHDHRPGSPRARDRARAPDRSVEVLAFLGAELRLSDRSGDRELVHVVELVGVSRIAPDPARENQHRDVVHVGLGNSGQGMRETGAGHQIHARDASG